MWRLLTFYLTFSAFGFVRSKYSHVIELDGGNFDTIVSKGAIAVEFYSSGCRHCEELAPEYEKAAKLLNDENSSIRLGKCNADDEKNKELVRKYNVQGFPWILFFRENEIETPKPYDDQKTAEAIVYALKRSFGPASMLLKTKEDSTKVAANEAVLIGSFGKEGPESKTFVEAAEKMREEPFAIAHTFNAKLLEPCTAAPEYCTGSLVFLLKASEKNISKFNGEFTVDALCEWAVKESIPKLTELIQTSPRHMKAVKAFFTKPEPRLIAFVGQEFARSDELKPLLAEAEKEEDSFNVLYVDASINSKASRFFGLKESDWPSLVMHDHSHGKKFIKKNFDVEDVKPFIAAYKAGELKETIKSEDPPKDDKGPVKRLVGKTFKSVFEAGKAVFLEFYASYCGHCKKLEPVYNSLGKHFKDDENVIIAKIDAAANDIPDTRFKIQGYPTLNYVSKEGEVLDYDGDRTLEDMINFIKRNLRARTEDPKEKEPTEETDIKEEL